MRRYTFLFATAALMLAGCSSVSVNRDYDTSYDFERLKTFAWKHAEQPETGNPRIDNDLIDRRVRAAVSAELARRGFQVADASSADCHVAYFIDYKQRVQGSSWSVGAGAGGYGRYGGMSYSGGIEDFEEGSLTIDIIDPANDKTVWRGVGARRSYETDNPEKITKIVNDAVARILKKFPPKS